MATREEIEETYDFMDEIFRVSFGEHADLTCAMYNGDFSKTLSQAQKDKHDYMLDGIGFKPGFRVLDIGCGFGPVLKVSEAQQIVKAFCQEHNISYHETGFVQSYREIFQYLNQVSVPLRGR